MEPSCLLSANFTGDRPVTSRMTKTAKCTRSCKGKAESGEQGDPLMLALFALGQHAAASIGEVVRIRDDIHAIVKLERVAEVPCVSGA